MSKAVITSKGQITIPADVRRRLGVDSGDRIEFVELESGGFAILPATGDVRQLKGLLRTPARPVPLEEMERAVRRRATGRTGR